MTGQPPVNFDKRLEMYDGHMHEKLEKGVERYLHLDFSKGHSIGHYIGQGFKALWLGLTFFASVPLLIARTANRNRTNLLKKLNEKHPQLTAVTSVNQLKRGKRYIFTDKWDGEGEFVYAHFIPELGVSDLTPRYVGEPAKEPKPTVMMRYVKNGSATTVQRQIRFIYEVPSKVVD